MRKPLPPHRRPPIILLLVICLTAIAMTFLATESVIDHTPIGGLVWIFFCLAMDYYYVVRAFGFYYED